MTDDLISRQVAIEAPEEFIKDCNPEHFVGHQKFIEFMDNAEIGSFGNWQFANGFNMGLTAAEVAIKELPSAPRWIPCKERLPEKFYERVLICGKRGGIAIANYRNILPGMSPFWVQGNKTMEAVAWMPLPEPWKVE